MAFEVAGSRVLITGGAGFVGSHIADQLIEAGASEVVVIDNLTRGVRGNLDAALASGRTRLIEGDIRDAGLLRREMDGVDYVFHQAALRITQCAEAPRAAFDTMATGAFNVLEAAVAAGVKKIVAASSASVYGEPDRLPIEEDAPYNNRTLYGALKIANEHLLRAYDEMYGLPYVALRYFNAYGPRMDIHGVYTEVLIRWMDRIDQGAPPLIFGDGEQSLDLVYAGDIARANLAALRSDASDLALNVASGTQTTLNELSRLLCELMGRADLEAEHRAERTVNPVRRRIASVRLAAERIGFRAETPLRVGLEELVRWRRRTLEREREPQSAVKMEGVA